MVLRRGLSRVAVKSLKEDLMQRYFRQAPAMRGVFGLRKRARKKRIKQYINYAMFVSYFAHSAREVLVRPSIARRLFTITPITPVT